MGRTSDKQREPARDTRSFSYRGRPLDDLANAIGIVAVSVGLPLFWHWSSAKDRAWSPWALLMAALLLLGAVSEALKGWRRLRDIRRRRERGETITVRPEGLVYEDRTSYVDVGWDGVVSLGQLEHLHLVKTTRGVIAFTEDLWGWQDLRRMIAERAQQAALMMPEEAAECAIAVDYPSAPPA